MPGTHPKSTPARYNKKSLTEALTFIQNGKSMRSTAKEFGMPYSTLWKKAKGNCYSALIE